MSEALSAEMIMSGLYASAQNLFSPIKVLSCVDSTNSYLLNLPVAEKQSGLVCVAEQQTAGRGRQGKPWISPAGENIYLSCLWKMPQQKNPGMVSLVVAMAVVKTLHDLSIVEAQVKWPNDILLQGKKLGGILLETISDNFVVIGMGLNVFMSHAHVDQPWTRIADYLPASISRNQIIASLLNHLSAELEQFLSHGLKKVCKEWVAVDALKDQFIRVKQGERIIQGIAQGISEEGALILNVEGQLLKIYSGEISKERSLRTHNL